MYKKRILADCTTIAWVKLKGLEEPQRIELHRYFYNDSDLEVYLIFHYPSFEYITNRYTKTDYVSITEPDFQHYCTPCDEHGNRIGSKPGRR